MVNKKKVGLGVGALAAAAAAGYYFYASKDAAKHRKIASKWAGGLKSDVVREAKKLKNIDRATVAKAVDSATAAYKGVRAVDPKEVMRAAKELKSNWREIVSEVKGGGPVKRAKKAVKKVGKSGAKRAK